MSPGSLDLKERFAKFGLELHPEKTRLIEFGSYAAERRAKRGHGPPETFDFLGFTHISGKTRRGDYTIHRKTSRKKFQAKLAELKEQLSGRRHADLAQSYGRLPLPEQRKSPVDQVPQVACVQMDGGRIQIRDRGAESSDQQSTGHWREILVGCCLSMISSEHPIDPCPTIPGAFVDPARMGELSREIKGFSSGEEDSAAASQDVPKEGVTRAISYCPPDGFSPTLRPLNYLLAGMREGHVVLPLPLPGLCVTYAAIG